MRRTTRRRGGAAFNKYGYDEHSGIVYEMRPNTHQYHIMKIQRTPQGKIDYNGIQSTSQPFHEAVDGTYDQSLIDMVKAKKNYKKAFLNAEVAKRKAADAERKAADAERKAADAKMQAAAAKRQVADAKMQAAAAKRQAAAAEMQVADAKFVLEQEQAKYRT